MGLGYRGRFQLPPATEIGICTHLPPVAKSISLSFYLDVVCAARARTCVSATRIAASGLVARDRQTQSRKRKQGLLDRLLRESAGTYDRI